ncbi:MAG TPA: Gfo/Idh/MocA family oxidoreductase [Solirubrobacteraceae bacterium]|jgi:predicted dehydrogenase
MRRVGIGLIGAGFMGSQHARGYRLARALRPDLDVEPELVVVADLDAQRAQALADAWRPGRNSAEWQSVVEDPAVDVVDICLPPFLHHQVAMAAIAAGKHVYCEKPVGLDIAETAELAAAAKAAGAHTLVGFNYRWIPAIATAKQIVESGRIGEIRNVAMSFDSNWAADPEGSWDWRFSAKLGGAGAIADTGSHLFDMARHLVGELDLVAAAIDTYIPQRRHGEQLERVDTDDAFVVIARFANGALGRFEGSRVAPGSTVDFSLTLTGTSGALRWDLQDMNKLELYERGTAPLDGFSTIVLGPEHPLHATFSPVRGLGVGFADSKTAEIQHLLECLATDVQPSPSFDDALAAAKLVDDALAAAQVAGAPAAAQLVEDAPPKEQRHDG